MKIFRLGNNNCPWRESCCPMPVPGPAGPAGPAGAPGAAYGINAYAGRYGRGEGTVTSAPGEESGVPLGTAMPARGADYTAENAITLERAGDYELAFFVAFTAAREGRFVAIVRANGKELAGTAVELALRGGEHITISGGVIAALAAGTVLDLALRSPEGAGAVLGPGVNAQLTVKMLNA